MGSAAEILVLPFFGQGHLNPGAEICKHFSSHNCKSFLITPSHLSSSIPSDIHHHPSIAVVEIDSSPSPTTEIPDGDSSAPETPLVFKQQQQLGHGIESFLAARFQNARPAFVVMDVMMHRCKEIFKKAKIPIVSLFTTCACATAMEYVEWKSHVENIGQDEAQLIPGFPKSIALSYSDTKRLRRNDQGGSGGGRPPRTNQVTRWNAWNRVKSSDEG